MYIPQIREDANHILVVVSGGHLSKSFIREGSVGWEFMHTRKTVKDTYFTAPVSVIFLMVLSSS